MALFLEAYEHHYYRWCTYLHAESVLKHVIKYGQYEDCQERNLISGLPELDSMIKMAII